MPLSYKQYHPQKEDGFSMRALPSRIFSKGRCKACAALDRKPIKKISDKRSMSLEEEDIQVLIAECDAVFSKYIRVKYSNEKGLCQCYTCGAEKRYQDLQCGHFIPRLNMATRYLPENCRVQCVGCNELARGNMKVFEQKLEAEHKGIVEWLREQGNSVYKPSRFELKEILVEYRCKLRTVQTKLIH
jgi:hypothetical protein